MAALIAKSATTAVASRVSLKRSVKAAPVVTPASANKMMVWQPINNKQFETFSYLPPLTASQIAKQVDYVVSNGWVPCLEFAAPDQAYISSQSTVRFGPVSCNYYDNRYWTMWKLPMFGCNSADAVLTEVQKCSRAFPQAYIRLVAFDNQKQVQIMGFLVQRPRNAVDYCDLNKRSVA